MTQPDRTGEPCRWRADIQLTADEARRCWESGANRPWKRIVYTVLIGLLLANNVYLLIVGPVQATAIVVSVLLFAAGAVLWLQPWWLRRQAIRSATVNTLTVAAYDTYAAFGREDPLYVPWSQCRAILTDDLLVLHIDDQRVGIPRRALDDTAWEWLCRTCMQKEEGA